MGMSIGELFSKIVDEAVDAKKAFSGISTTKDANSGNGESITREFIISKLLFNRFHRISLGERPLIVVFRETDRKLGYVKNNWTNNCDTICLMDSVNLITLSGRTFMHKKYLDAAIAGGDGCNYIASSYTPYAWTKGFHRKMYRALLQNVVFQIWRTKDTVIKDDDDLSYSKNVGDNFHACAPYSAGCVTVQGYPDLDKYPQGLSGDWKIADNWLYNTHKGKTYFDCVIFEHYDAVTSYPLALRLGSSGDEVKAVQKKLGLSLQDGIFGPDMFIQVQKWQDKNKYFHDGVLWPEQIGKLGL